VAAWTVRFVESYLYEMTVYDPVAWTVAIGVLLFVTLVAALLPSLRASRVDPVRALRDA
jgi:ABC-type antimicrobial peptide transport system permease subunit